MLILPDRRISHCKYLMPMRKRDWMPPSLSLKSDPAGNTNGSHWRVNGYNKKGEIVWSGVFDDRDDCDAFMAAFWRGTLDIEKSLWELPTPAYYSYGEPLLFKARAYTWWTTLGATSWTIPIDWNNADNVFRAIGGGMNGSASYGAGGAAYAESRNISLTKGAAGGYAYVGSANGVGRTGTGSPGAGDSFFHNGSSVIFLANGAGNNSALYQPGYAGYCTYNYTANQGGQGATGFYDNSGGGAGGAEAAGGAGGYRAAGGAGNGGYYGGGAGGAFYSGTGGNGTNVYGGLGSGGGGGSAYGVYGGGGNAGSYGGGGGGGLYSSGYGLQGFVLIDYRPPTGGFNTPMLGM